MIFTACLFLVFCLKIKSFLLHLRSSSLRFFSMPYIMVLHIQMKSTALQQLCFGESFGLCLWSLPYRHSDASFVVSALMVFWESTLQSLVFKRRCQNGCKTATSVLDLLSLDGGESTICFRVFTRHPMVHPCSLV